MKGLLAAIALVPTLFLPLLQEQPAVDSNLTIIGYGVDRVRTLQGLSADDSDGFPGGVSAQQRVPGDMNDVTRRSVGLGRPEQGGTDAAGLGRDQYEYKMKVRNTDHRAIERVIWQFETKNPGDPDRPTVRQFLCGNRIKPGDSKELKVITPFVPSNVVSVDNAGKDSDEKSNQRAVINKVEYADGTVWQNPDWDLPRVEDRLSEETYKSAKGRCVVL